MDYGDIGKSEYETIPWERFCGRNSCEYDHQRVNVVSLPESSRDPGNRGLKLDHLAKPTGYLCRLLKIELSPKI